MIRAGLIFIYFLFISCEQNEIAIEKHPMGEIEESQISMGSNYSRQIFYNASTNMVVSNNLKTDWDLAFETSENGAQIIINSSTFSQISELTNHMFDDPVPVSIQDLTWQWDSPEGIYYSTAFGVTPSSNTYILDRGYNLDGTSRGYRKIKIDSVNSTAFFITCANLDNTGLQNFEVKKDSRYNYQYLSFNDNSILNIEPPKDDWDLVFTQYTHLFVDNIETPAYLVTGVLINYLNNVMVAKDTVNSFDAITLDIINTYSFSNYQDAIGYNWKEYNFQSQAYTVNTDITYILKDVSDRYFKMRFIDFYNDNGIKGYPKFEIQEL